MAQGKSIFFQSCERVRIERTGEVISLYSNSTLQECGMLTGDVLFPEQPGPLHLQELTSGDHSDSGADGTIHTSERFMFYQLVTRSGCFPQNSFEAVVVAAHYYLLACTDLVCLV